MSTFQHILRASLITSSIAALSIATSALAQESEDPAAETSGTGLDVIVVTANRREENLQDVAISAATLDDDRVQTLFAAGTDNTGLSGQVPGLFVESSNGRAAPRFYIRGLGNTDFDLAASQPVSVIMDDVEHIEGTGKVVRVESDPPGMGVVFTELSEYSQRLIARLLTAPNS